MSLSELGSEAALRLDADFALLSAPDRLRHLREEIGGAIVFTTSFGLEDQVLTHFICAAGLDIEIATLDTGRLFSQTYTLWAATEARFNRRIRAFYPNGETLERLVADQGVDGFFGSVDMRKACCGVRKVEPLGRALKGAAAWVAGLRADQSADRARTPFVEFDKERNVLKANPLLDWSRAETLDFARATDIPINPLHAEGFLSIGCAPCTRAVRPGEDERAGRWWWENDAQKECGLHVAADGRLIRASAGAPQKVGAAP